MRYKHETCTKVIPKECTIPVVTNNKQICKASHIIQYTRGIMSHGNTTTVKTVFLRWQNAFMQIELNLVYR